MLVASRPLADGEELLLDYKLRREGPLEQWYHHVESRAPDAAPAAGAAASAASDEAGAPAPEAAPAAR